MTRQPLSTDNSSTNSSDHNSGGSSDNLHSQPITLGGEGVGVRLSVETWERQSAGIRLRLHTFLLRILWPGGGYVWQTPIRVGVTTPTEAEQFWIVDWTRLALTAILLLTSVWVWDFFVGKGKDDGDN